MTNKSKTRILITLSLVFFSFLFIQFLFGTLPGVFHAWEARTEDRLFDLRLKYFGKQKEDPNIVHVDINNSSVAAIDTFYWGRRLYSRMIRLLSKTKVRGMAFDIIFARPSGPSDDSLLIQATHDANNVYYPVAFTLVDEPMTTDTTKDDQGKFINRTKWHVNVLHEGEPYYGTSPLTLTFAELRGIARGIGFINAITDHDGVYRRIPLLMKFNDGYYPSMPFRMLCDYLSVKPEQIVVDFGREIILMQAKFPGGQKKDIHIPIDENGQMIINWVGKWGTFTHYSFVKLLDLSENPDGVSALREEIANSLVIISDVSTGASDVGPIPVESYYPLSGLHANVLNTILTENFLKRIDPLSVLGIELSMVILIAILSLNLRPLKFSFAAVVLMIGYVGFVFLAFLSWNLLVNMVSPLMTTGLAIAFVLTYRYLAEQREKEFFRRTFENYFNPAVVKKITENPDLLSLGGERKMLTILFSDISEFTSWCSDKQPDEIKRTLNEYFEEMAQIVFQYDGTIDKYIGDGMMVFFGDPINQQDHALRAVRAAIDMQRKVRELKQKWEAEGRLPIKIRVGINTGEVVVGNMGSMRRMDYTVLGSHVNLAQRLESKAPVEGILISESVYAAVNDHVKTRHVGNISVKGLAQEVNVYEVLVE